MFLVLYWKMIARVSVIVLAVAAVAVGGFFFWRYYGAKITGHCSYDAEFCSYLSAVKSQKSYTVTVLTPDLEQQAVTQVGESGYHTTVKQQNNVISETIVTGGKVYFKQDSGWGQVDGAGAAAPHPLSSDDLKNAKVKKLPKGDCKQGACLGFSITYPDGHGITLVVDPSTYLPKSEGASTPKGQPTFATYTFGPVTITAPSGAVKQ